MKLDVSFYAFKWSRLVKYRLVMPYCRGTLLVAQLVEALRYKPEGRGFDS